MTIRRLPQRKGPRRKRSRLEALEALGQGNLFRAPPRLIPLNPQAPFTLAVDLERAGRHDEAIAAYENAVRAGVRRADALCNLGALAHERGDLAAARSYLTRALADTPMAVAHYNLGTLLLDLGEAHGALAHFTLAAAAGLDDEDLHQNRALAAFLTDDVHAQEEAAAALTRLGVRPPDLRAAP